MVPLLPYFLVYTGGVLCSLPPAWSFLFPGFLPLTVTTAGLIFSRRSLCAGMWRGVLLSVLFVLGLILGAGHGGSRPPDHILNHLREGRPGTVTGQVIQPPIVFPNKVRYTLGLLSIRYGDQPITVSGRARINLYRSGNSLAMGDVARFRKVRLKKPRNFKNPGRFDYQRYMRSLGIDVTGSASKPHLIDRLGHFEPPWWSRLREESRTRMTQMIDHRFPEREGALIKAMVLGEKQFLPDDLRETYIATGLAHLLAVSGLHLGFVAGAVFLVLYTPVFYLLYKFFPDAARAGWTKKIAALACLFPVLFYMALVGPKISALRAGMMVIVYLAAVLVNRENHLHNALLLAAFALLLWNPSSILNVSFQLSFMAVLAILTALEFLRRQDDDPVARLGDNPKSRKWVRGTVWVSLAAYLGTLPLLIVHFNRVSLVGWPLNLLMVPLAMALIPLVLFALSAGLVWPGFASALLLPCLPLAQLFTALPARFASVPFSSLYVPTPPPVWPILYYFVLFALPYWILRNRKEALKDPDRPKSWNPPLATALAVAALATAVWLIQPRFPQWNREPLAITVLDVGQGESIFIRFPDHQTLLIDGGGFYRNILDVGKVVVAPFLWHEGIRKLDFMVATHSDNDHVSGLESLLTFFPMRRYLDRAMNPRDPRLNKLRRRAQERGVPTGTLEPGRPITVGEVKLIPLHPGSDYPRPRNTRSRISNDLSLVLRLEYRQFTMLFTGDIGEKAERYLVEHSAPLRADVLKAPHHGSRHSNSPGFIQAVAPRDVVFSSGYLNPFHHPAPQVVQRYRKRGIKVWRTDLNGAVLITTDGKSYQVKTHENL